jgi:hypothetical protein
VREFNNAPEIGVPMSIDVLTRENATPIRVLPETDQSENIRRKRSLTHAPHNDSPSLKSN